MNSTNPTTQHWIKRLAMAIVAIAMAAGIWLPCLHWLYQPSLQDYRRVDGVAPQASAIAARHLRMWTDPVLREAELKRMRQSNAEWDFMGRTYLVLALANMAIHQPQQEAQYLEIIDHIIEQTHQLEQENGMYHFLMDYAKRAPYVATPARSIFTDGEIAMMLGARRLVRDDDALKQLMKKRIAIVTASLADGPVLCAESYPDECWTFCNMIGLASMRMHEVLDGADHSAFFEKWLTTAKTKLIHKETGLLISAFTYNGVPTEGPEGSSIWMIAHCLQLIDPDFAADQYRRAKEQLAGDFLGFSYAREWPASWQAMEDIDSGPIVPGLEASTGSSGLALLGDSSFNDDPWLSSLIGSLNFMGFPMRDGENLRYAASNQVGDAVLLYALVHGPLWQRINAGARP